MIDSGDVKLDENFTTFYMEMVCTFVFVLFILHVTGKHTGGDDIGAWKVPAICLNLATLCKINCVSGASYNPALATGLTVFQSWWYPTDPSGIMTHYLPIYISGALAGGIAAGMFFWFHETLFIKDDREEQLAEYADHSDKSESARHKYN